jgi:hypothetical protein
MKMVKPFRTNDLKTRQGFIVQPPSHTRSTLSRVHTHFYTPQTFKNTSQFPSWPTVLPYLSQYPLDSRQQLSFQRLRTSRFFQRVYSSSLHPALCLFDNTAKLGVGTFPSYSISSANPIAHSIFLVALRYSITAPADNDF